MASPAWDRLFRDAWEGCGADVHIVTERKSYIQAHSNILSMASPFLHTLLEKSKVKKGIKIIQMLGVPHEAVNLFIRFLYTSWYMLAHISSFSSLYISCVS